AGAGRGGSAVGLPGADPGHDSADAQGPGRRGSTVSGSAGPDRHQQPRQIVSRVGSIALGGVLLVWSLTPLYNMLLIALDPDEGETEFAGNILPPDPSLEGFRQAITQQARYLENYWYQLGNSFHIGLLTMFLTVLIASLASFGVGRMRLRNPSMLPSAAI